MKNLKIFTRCFWFNYNTKLGLLCLFIFVMFFYVKIYSWGSIFLVLTLLFFVYSHFGLRSYRSYKKSPRQLNNGYMLDPRSYNEFIGLDMARLDFEKKYPDKPIQIRCMRGFKKRRAMIMY
jgi:hypothetical protein